jgi:hypothetical protein
MVPKLSKSGSQNWFPSLPLKTMLYMLTRWCTTHFLLLVSKLWNPACFVLIPRGYLMPNPDEFYKCWVVKSLF